MEPYTVRVVYIVPTRAESWDEAKPRATDLLEDLQWFFADEMNRLGYGPKTFKIARDRADELIFHRIPSIRPKEEFQNRKDNGDQLFVDYCKEASDVFGLRTVNDIVIYFFESYSILNGVVSGGTRGGRAAKKRGSGGEAFISSLNLKTASREWITSDIRYDGQIRDLQGRPKWDKRVSDRLGDLSGGAYGITAHEFGHCLGAQHDRSDDKKLLMDSGYRFMRGTFRPDLTATVYPKAARRCEVSIPTAEALDRSGFFDFRELKQRSAVWQRT
ncbi:MAG: hypothetical protein H0U18_08815 [Pyrinomonadaceae bacterium]|jgi:hypothetical protein|nr:hypothetical protein [Pyrinomonadaceae bacterium]